MSIGNHAYTLIDFDFVELLAPLRRFFVYPDPMGSEENQFTPPSPSRSRFGGARLGLE